jgi:hypothetical protein
MALAGGDAVTTTGVNGAGGGGGGVGRIQINANTFTPQNGYVMSPDINDKNSAGDLVVGTASANLQ